jgi:uncharacterized Zn finger protein
MYLLSKNDSDSLQNWIKELKEFQLDSMFDTNVLGRAYLYTNSLTSLATEDNMLVYEVGKNTIYHTKLISSNGAIYGSCTCPFDGKCKHIAACILVAIKDQKQ